MISRSFFQALVLALPLIAADPVYDPLMLYNGEWLVTSKPAAVGATPVRLLNDCKQLGQFFACHQTADGTPGSLLIFLPREYAGKYFTQTIRTNGAAMGRGDLTIAGNLWTFSSKDIVDGKTKYYKTTNQFSGKNKIHYEMSESLDDKTWTVIGSGDEERVVVP